MPKSDHPIPPEFLPAPELDKAAGAILKILDKAVKGDGSLAQIKRAQVALGIAASLAARANAGEGRNLFIAHVEKGFRTMVAAAAATYATGSPPFLSPHREPPVVPSALLGPEALGEVGNMVGDEETAKAFLELSQFYEARIGEEVEALLMVLNSDAMLPIRACRYIACAIGLGMFSRYAIHEDQLEDPMQTVEEYMPLLGRLIYDYAAIIKRHEEIDRTKSLSEAETAGTA